jgi:hypothetical protein
MPPDAEAGIGLPEKDEPVRIVGDIAQVNPNLRVQKALRRLAAGKAPTTIAQLVMWRLSAGLEWDAIARLSERWANTYEVALARDFTEHLDGLDPKTLEAGCLAFQIVGTGAVGQVMAKDLTRTLEKKTVLGLQAVLEVPTRPDGPSVACKVRLGDREALVQVAGSDASAQNWVPFGKFTLPIAQDPSKRDMAKFADALAEGILNRMVRAQLGKGPRVKGKLTYQLRIDNASPLILSGLSVLGPVSRPEESPKPLLDLSIPPRKSLTLPVGEDAVKALGLKQGIRVIAVDLSGL